MFYMRDKYFLWWIWLWIDLTILSMESMYYYRFGQVLLLWWICYRLYYEKLYINSCIVYSTYTKILLFQCIPNTRKYFPTDFVLQLNNRKFSIFSEHVFLQTSYFQLNTWGLKWKLFAALALTKTITSEESRNLAFYNELTVSIVRTYILSNPNSGKISQNAEMTSQAKA